MSDLIYISKRFIHLIFLSLFISFLTFSLMKADFKIPQIKLDIAFIHLDTKEIHIQTGDPLADLRLNPAISAAQIEAESKRLGLDKGFNLLLFRLFLLFLLDFLFKTLWIVIFRYILNSEVFQN